MALDSRSKRASSVGIGLLFILAPPLPDGTLDQGDRQHVAVSYSGILAGTLNLPDADIVTATVYLTREATTTAYVARSVTTTVER